MKKILYNFFKSGYGRKLITSIDSKFDKNFLSKDVPLSNLASHTNWVKYVLDIANKPGVAVLERGSREVTGKSEARQALTLASYTGFDYYPGGNVDVVGDVHKLSSYFAKDQKFDVIYSASCFEHFAMPWIAATEIAKMLKVGGTLFIETHFSFVAHERPWNFFQYSDMGLRVLFSSELGFECIEAGMSNPIVGRFSSLADDYLKNKPLSGLYCHSEYLGKKIKNVEDFDWAKVDINKLVAGTKYPPPKSVPANKEKLLL